VLAEVTVPPPSREELRLYAPLVAPGCYLVCEDTNVNGHPVYPEFGPGPMEAVDRFLSENDEFVIDERCERFLLTMHPSGYLRRVRPYLNGMNQSQQTSSAPR